MPATEYFYTELDVPGTGWVPVGYRGTQAEAEKLYNGLLAAGLHVRLVRHGPRVVKSYDDPAPKVTVTAEPLTIYEQAKRATGVEPKARFDVFQPRGGGQPAATIEGAVQVNDKPDFNWPWNGVTAQQYQDPKGGIAQQARQTLTENKAANAAVEQALAPLPVLPARINPDETGPMMAIRDDAPAEASPADVRRYLAGQLHPGDPGYVAAARAAMVVRRDPHQGTRVSRQMG